MSVTDIRAQRPREWAWALYDVASSSFATTVMAAFFPVFLKQFWAADRPPTESTFWLGIATSSAALVSLVLAPILGAWSDAASAKKPLLGASALLGVIFTGGLFWVGPGQDEIALTLFALATVAFSVGMVFYDSLLPAVTDPSRFERISSLGVGLGYLGGGSLFALNVLMTSQPDWFGLADASAAVRWSFLTVAIWWLVFTLPLLFIVHEPQLPRAATGNAVRASLLQLRETFRDIRRLKVVALFLGAYWLYIDGVDTIVHMAVDYGLAIGFGAAGLMTALLVTQFVGAPATIAFGWLGERFGPKPAIFGGLLVYALLVLWATRMREAWEFYGIATGIGLVQGGVQALSRALYARIVPAARAGEFFGFMNLLGKFAAVLGPALVGLTSRLTGEPRLSLLSLLLLFGGGAWLLARVDVAEGEKRAGEW